MEKDNSIDIYEGFTKFNSNSEEFFKDVLLYCYKKNLIDENSLTNIYYERMELLKEKLKYYTRDQSTSVMVEKADELLQCIDYTIGIYLKTFKNIKLVIEELKTTSLRQLLENGQNLIDKKIICSEKLLQEISKNKLKVNNYSYNDTIDDGFTLFLKEYNPFFFANQADGSIDYQLCIDDMNCIGIEYINNYLYTLKLENEFCININISEINNILKSYARNSEELLINIFELTLTNCIGEVICGRDLTDLDISSLDRDYIKINLEKFNLAELKNKIIEYAKECCDILNIKDNELISYVEKAAAKIASSINQGIKLDKLENVFLSFIKEDENSAIHYTDGERMENSEFKNLSEEIRDCALVSEKINLINDNIKSLEDLVDILGADCLFEEEYIVCFKNLSKIQIVLLSRYIDDTSFEDEYEKEWYNKFNEYIIGLSEKEQKLINELKERIYF